ncbi:RdgB/HAM1 family non-canonical purine NTP pyrophosphatase [Arsukibacterium sp.]|uniref:RdgB/HAM1 family non-canonical purine NTP pyrophosphatase n=1 Tax=Arsukibacterium sp. TaxID=1977258 RepID=UPI002FDAB839
MPSPSAQAELAGNHTLVLASGNKGKVAELSAMLAELQLSVVPQTELLVNDIEETGLSFVENAILKARNAAIVTGLPALADDSGLAVDALKGAPGIYSARFAGEAASDQDNIDKLLQQLQTVPEGQRQAQFHCVLVYMRHAADPTPLICHGIWPGTIALESSGNGGFGYDPVFIPDGLNVSAACLDKAQKAAISHRGQALRQLLALLQAQQTAQLTVQQTAQVKAQA